MARRPSPQLRPDRSQGDLNKAELGRHGTSGSNLQGERPKDLSPSGQRPRPGEDRGEKLPSSARTRRRAMVHQLWIHHGNPHRQHQYPHIHMPHLPNQTPQKHDYYKNWFRPSRRQKNQSLRRSSLSSTRPKSRHRLRPPPSQ